MNAYEIVERLRELRPSIIYQDDVIVDWIYKVDKKIRDEIHGELNAEYGSFELSAPPEYADIYIYFALAMIHFHNGEYDKYNNVVVQFESAFEEYAKKYIREHNPGSSEVKVW